MKKKVLIIGDNEDIYKKFVNLLHKHFLDIADFDLSYSLKKLVFKSKYLSRNARFIDLKNEKVINKLISKYDLILSLHCKSIFPKKLIDNVRCINVHPGLNPYNRGWYPQAFSIINGLPYGVTIHEMDENIDKGRIIYQKNIKIDITDNLYTLYKKSQREELLLLKNNLVNIINKNYKTLISKNGNINTKKDFEKICNLNLDDKDTLLAHLNLLRALTHKNFFNAYFLDDHGNKVFVKLELVRESK